MSALIRRIRQPYYPAWGDEKYRQGVRSASLNWFGVDRSEEIFNETHHRQQRTSSPHLGAQPWPDAELKVWHRIGRAAGNEDLLETGPFDGPMGRVEPGDRLRLYVAPPDDDSPLRGDMTGRFLGTQLIDGRKHVVLEIVATDQGSYRTVIPVEDAGRLTKIGPPEGGEA